MPLTLFTGCLALVALAKLAPEGAPAALFLILRSVWFYSITLVLPELPIVLRSTSVEAFGVRT